MPQVLHMKDYELQNSQNYEILNMKDSQYENASSLHSVLDMSEYVWIDFGLKICQDSEYGRVLNMQRYTEL